MTVLRLLALVAIAGVCVGIFAVAYLQLLGLSAAERAEDAASKLADDIKWVIINGDPRTTNLSIPSGYSLRLENTDEGNLGKWQLAIDGMRLPEEGFKLNPPLVGIEFDNFSELGAREHELHIEIEDDQVVVSKVG